MTWVYLSLDLKRGTQFSSPSPLFFHIILLSLGFCGINAGYTHVTESWSCLGLRSTKRACAKLIFSSGVSEGGSSVECQNWQSQPMFSQAVTSQLRAVRDGSLAASSSTSSVHPQSPFTAPTPEFRISAEALPDLQLPPLTRSPKLRNQGSSLSLLLSLWNSL